MQIYVSQRCVFLAAALVFVLLFPSLTDGQWISDSTHNTIVCDTTGVQDNPAIAADGLGGALIAWEDSRSTPTRIYAQRLNSAGIPMWTRQGVQLCRTSSQQVNPVIASDGKGGAYVCWQDYRFATTLGKSYFGQHILASGSLAYPDTGLPLILGPNDEQNAKLCGDGRGNAFIVAEDNRSIDIQSRPDLVVNKLWPGGVKYTDSICTGSIGSMRTPITWPPTPAQFNDGNATFKSVGEGVLPNLILYVPGKGKYQIASVLDDTSLTLKSSPQNFEEQRYYIMGLRGKAIDTSLSKQRNPVICNDGAGGCYIAWETSNTSPNSIRAMHFDSAFNRLWISTPGYQISRGSENASHVAISLDTVTHQLMLAWEVRSGITADTQDVWVTRLNCESPADTTLTWSLPVQITGDALLNQVTPQIFSDDSAVTWPNGRKVRGLMVPFETGSIGAAPDAWDVGMNRVTGDGTTISPTVGSWFKIVSQPNGQVGFKAVQVDTGLILAVWNDARFDGSPDTCVYAQVVDKWGWRHIPSWKSGSSWGLPVCHGSWTAKHVVLAPTQNGGIAAWTDFRKGSSNPGIYAQVIFRDGTLPIELESFGARCTAPGEVRIEWKTASEESTRGFEIERRVADEPSDFVTVGSYRDHSSLAAAGSSSFERDYHYTDRVAPNKYEYRLAEVSLDGSRKTHQIVRVDASRFVMPEGFSAVAFPAANNPFVRFTTAHDVTIDCTVFDLLGRVVAKPHQNESINAGTYDLELPGISQASGTYFVAIQAREQETGELIWQGISCLSLSTQ